MFLNTSYTFKKALWVRAVFLDHMESRQQKVTLLRHHDEAGHPVGRIMPVVCF